MLASVAVPTLVNDILKLQEDDETLSFREVLKRVFRSHRTDFVEPFCFTMDTLTSFVGLLQYHALTTDAIVVQGLTSEEVKKQIQLEQGLKQASKIARVPEKPKWINFAMTPLSSSMIKGAGSFEKFLLLEFHHDPGNIWGFPIIGGGSKPGEFFQELMKAGSKGGWVWENILGKPSKFGMAKGTFHAYKGNDGKTTFHTSKGAQFVHKHGRPTKFSTSPVGYRETKGEYEGQAEIGKTIKEKIVAPPKSAEPIDPQLLKTFQKEQQKLIKQIKFLIQLKRGKEIRARLEKLGQEPTRDPREFSRLQKEFKEVFKFPYIPSKRPKTVKNPKGVGRKKKQGRPRDMLEFVRIAMEGIQIWN